MIYRKSFFLGFFLLFFTFSLSFGETFSVRSTEELINALNQAAVNGEDDIIIVSSGKYNIENTITVSVLDGKSLTIKGENLLNKPTLFMNLQQDKRKLFIFKIKMKGDDFGSKVEFNGISFKGSSIEENTLAIQIDTVNGDIYIKNCEFDKFRVPAVKLFSQTGNIYIIQNSFKEIDSFDEPLSVPYIDCSDIYQRSDPFLVFKGLKNGSITSKSVSGNICLINNDFMDHISLKSKVSTFSLIDSSNSSENGKVIAFGNRLNSLYIYKADEVKLENNELNRLIVSYSKNLYAERNIFKGNTYYGYFHLGGIVNVENSNFKNNVFIAYPIYDYKGNIYNGEFSTFHLCFIPDSQYKNKSSVKLINNTFVTKLKGKKNTYAYIKAKKATIYNNILEHLNLDVYEATIKNNLFSPEVSLDLNNPFNIVADPEFQSINDNEQDYHISKNSPAIDKGRNISIEFDIDGNPRIEGEAIDIGADEYTDKKYPVSFKYFKIIPDTLRPGDNLFSVFKTEALEDTDVACSISLWNNEKSFEIPDCKGFHIIKGKALNTGNYQANLYVKSNNNVLYKHYDIISVEERERPPFIKFEYPKIIRLPTNVNFRTSIIDDEPEKLQCELKIFRIYYSLGEELSDYKTIKSCNPESVYIEEFPENYRLDQTMLFIRFTAKDDDGYVYKKEDYIYTEGSSKLIPVIEVKPSKTAGYAPLKVNFDIDVYDEFFDNDICEIDFDNDGTVDKTIQNCIGHYTVSFLYENEGLYSPIFTVKNRYKTSKKVIEKIEVRGGNKPPQAEFKAIPSQGDVPLGIVFSIKVSDPNGELIKCELDFNGDGKSDEVIEGCMDELVPHMYTEPGTYNAILSITDEHDSTVSYFQTITVNKFKKKRKASIVFDDKSFNAVKQKLHLPDSLKGKRIDISVESNGDSQNNTPTISPKEDTSPLPVVGEMYITDVKEYDFPLGILNMKVENISPGEEVYIKVKLPDKIPKHAQFVKLLEDGTVIKFPQDKIKSSKDGENWEDGLIPEYTYIKFLIKDGGEFDEDREENGTIVDPSGIAVPENINENNGENNSNNTNSGGSGGGCSIETNSQITNLLPYISLLILFIFRFFRRERAS